MIPETKRMQYILLTEKLPTKQLSMYDTFVYLAFYEMGFIYPTVYLVKIKQVQCIYVAVQLSCL